MRPAPVQVETLSTTASWPMRRVKDTVASFGGDPVDVTRFGESAGSGGVGIHIVSPDSGGMTRRRIMESGVSTRGGLP